MSKWTALWWVLIKEVKRSELAQSCTTLCDPMDCSLSGSSVHGILQARILAWVAISSSRGSSQPRNRTQVSLIAGKHFTIWATRETSSNYTWQLPKMHLQPNLPLRARLAFSTYCWTWALTGISTWHGQIWTPYLPLKFSFPGVFPISANRTSVLPPAPTKI